MKFCYVDESGVRKEDPCLTMVGVIADAYRLKRTNEEFHSGFFSRVQELFLEPLAELKGSKLVFGRNRWRKVDQGVRRDVILELCEWPKQRKHKLAIAAVDKSRVAAGGEGKVRDPWVAAALHVALQNQRAHQAKGASKGRTVLVFDDNKQKMDVLSQLLWEPPSWTDDFYERDRKAIALDQIIDTAFAVNSRHAGLVQVADVFSLIIRRYIELKGYASGESFGGESALVDECVELLKPCLLPRSHRYPRSSSAARFFREVTPPTVLQL